MKFVENLQDLSNYKPSQKIQYVCPNCSKLRSNYVSNFLNGKPLICNYCKAKKLIYEKKKQTMKSHFGENFKDVINEKRKQTCQNKDWSEKTKKQEQTCLKKYGVKNPGAWRSGKLKAKQTSMQRYGVAHYQQSQEAKNRKRKLSLSQYGIESYFQSEDFKKKKEQTVLRKYKVRHPMQNPEINKKRQNTFLKRYGPYYLNLKQRYVVDNEYFDSAWELATWLYCKVKNISITRNPCVFEYEFEGRIHKYYPDFKIEDQLVEIKGPRFFSVWGNTTSELINPFLKIQTGQEEAKHQCGLQNNVEFWSIREMQPILEFVREAYGKNFKATFKKFK